MLFCSVEQLHVCLFWFVYVVCSFESIHFVVVALFNKIMLSLVSNCISSFSKDNIHLSRSTLMWILLHPEIRDSAFLFIKPRCSEWDWNTELYFEMYGKKCMGLECIIPQKCSKHVPKTVIQFSRFCKEACGMHLLPDAPGVFIWETLTSRTFDLQEPYNVEKFFQKGPVLWLRGFVGDDDSYPVTVGIVISRVFLGKYRGNTL